MLWRSYQGKPKLRHLAEQMFRVLWAQRTYIARILYTTGYIFGWIFDKFPIPKHIKEIATEITFHSIEHFIVQSSPYQRWLTQRSGLSHLHGLLSARYRSKEIETAKVNAPSELEWEELLRLPPEPHKMTLGEHPICVVIPIHTHPEAALRCIYSVLRAKVNCPFTITVIEDGCEDALLKAQLDRLQKLDKIELIRHEKNEGYVASVNHGMQRKEQSDIVLLNADMEVFDGWLDKLHQALYSAADIASVTAFSNKPEHTGYPLPFHYFPLNQTLAHADISRLCASVNAGLVIEIPTSARYTMMIRRKALEEVGYFDEDPFVRDYGEDQDWCLRAAQVSTPWRHVLAADVFVAYHGNRDHETFRARRSERSFQRLSIRHPHYRHLIADYRENDPLRIARIQIDLAQLLSVRDQKAVLFISHNVGGGTETHIKHLTEQLAHEGVTAYRLSPDIHHTGSVRIWHDAFPDCPNLIFDLDREQVFLESVLRQLQISFMHIHHLIGFPQRMLDYLPLLCNRLNLYYYVTIHDYYFACPSINLILNGRAFSHNPSLEESQHWANQHPSQAGRMPLWQWRHQHFRLLKEAKAVFTPSDDCTQRMLHYFPLAPISTRQHPESFQPLFSPQREALMNKATRQIAIIGHLSKHKGAQVVSAMAKDAATRNLPLHFHIFGEAQEEKPLKKSGKVTLHGAYQEEAIYALLRQHSVDLAFFASVWPETYSYTLSIALNSGVYPVLFDIGAPAERLRKTAWGSLLPIEFTKNPSAINDALLSCRITAAEKEMLMLAFCTYGTLLKDFYEEASSDASSSEKAMCSAAASSSK